jgi:hypothetical protein
MVDAVRADTPVNPPAADLDRDVTPGNLGPQSMMTLLFLAKPCHRFKRGRPVKYDDGQHAVSAQLELVV